MYIYICMCRYRVLDRVPRRRKRKAHSQEPQTVRVEDLRFTSLKALRGMLERRLGISLSDRKREIRHYAEMVVTEIAAGEPRSTVANEVHGDSLAGSTPCNGGVEIATTVHTVACDAHRNNRRGRQLFRELHDEVGIVKRWRGQWEPLSARSGFLEKRCFTDLVATSLSGQQICRGGVRNRVCTSAGGGVACKVHADAGTCLDQQHVIFAGILPEDCSISSDYSIQPAVIEVLTASLIELGLVLEEKRQPSKSTETSPRNACRLFCH